ncbi:hypothetical protein COLO4_05354 [Corchorus olitorius]|uniref:Uncharacterized protein n=1 Tax=Corchorus olitorius TaxID=93759 RepID=A0A1R3KR54_9ROSI|nr:hypothetical protein COLO4_05354 [Corchorus olitorius]
MAARAASSLQIAAARPCISSSHRVKAGAAILGVNSKCFSSTKLTSAHSSTVDKAFQAKYTSNC